nr:CoA transferase [Streptomyces albus]
MTVVALEQAVAGPYATRQLADSGRPCHQGGTARRRGFRPRVRQPRRRHEFAFVWANRGKESLTCDLKHPRGMAVLRALLERADVFVQNLAPGATRRLGLDAASLREALAAADRLRHLRLRPGGPYETAKAYDLLVAERGGTADR